LSRDKGATAVTSEDLGRVSLSGKNLKVFSGERWRAVGTCDLQLQPQDASLALTLLKKERALLSDIFFNIWDVDVKPRGAAHTFDLLGDFHSKASVKVEGRVWVELKVLSEGSFEKQVEKLRPLLVEGLARERERDATLGGIMLLAAKVGRSSGSVVLFAELFTQTGGWKSLAGGVRKTGRGMCEHTKPPLATIFSKKMVWYYLEQPGRKKVGLLRDFLKPFDLPYRNTGQRAATFNAKLGGGGVSGRLFEAKLKNKCGRKPWVGTKKTFRAVYKHL